MRKLAILALSGFAICALSLGGAAALGGVGGGGNIGNWIAWGGGEPRCELSPSGQSATRSLAWDGSDSAGVAVPATVHYRRGQGDQLVVQGDSALLPHVRVVDGSVEFDCRTRGLHNVRLDLTLPGRAFKEFSLAGMGDMTLEDIDQPDLELTVAGMGNIAASGKVKNLKLQVAGKGQANLAQLAVDRAELNVAGSGTVDVGPKDDLEANIVGTGRVTLDSEPRSIETNIIGSGRIIHPDGSTSSRQHI